MHLASYRTNIVLLAIVIALAGCARIPADRGFATSAALIAKQGGPSVAVPDSDAESKRQTASWVSAPLTVESAQRVALTRNPKLILQYARLSLAQAEVYDAARISNPLFSLAWLDGSAGGEQIGLGLAQNFADLLHLSTRKRRAGGELARTQQDVAGQLLKLATDVEGAYYTYLSAVAVADLRETIANTGKPSAALAERFFDAGNLSRLELSREQAAATELRITADRAAVQGLATRTALNTLLGLTADEDHWTATAHLPLPVSTEDELSALQHVAEVSRLDLLAARNAVVLREDSLGVARSYRLVGDIAVGIDYEHETDGSRLLGPTLGLTLPIFNWGSGRVERARAELEQARADARQLELNVSNGVVLAYASVLNARKILERYRTQLIPQRETVVRHAAAMQNYMIIGQFEVLQAKQQEYAAYQGYLEALGQYWISRASLAGAIGARLPSATQISSENVESPALNELPQNDGTAPEHNHNVLQEVPGSKTPHAMDMNGMDPAGHGMPSNESTSGAQPAGTQPSPSNGKHQH